MGERDETSFGAWLRRLRRALDLTQADLAARVGVSAAAIRKIEADERRPSAQVADLLAEALAVPPGERGRFLRQARGVMAARPAGGDAEPRSTSSPAVSPPPVEAPLPLPLTPLVGRAGLVAQLIALLERADARLVTLAGPGGVGKTRVALQIAAELRAAGRAAFPDGVAFAPLAAATGPAGVETALLRALGLRDPGHRPALDQLSQVLHGRRMVLVLDNAEHVLGAAPGLVALLAGAPGLRLLVTSRAVLGVAGEHIVVVPPLDLPAPGAPDVAAAPAVRLFLERARAAAPFRAWPAEELAAVAAICRQLDGLPLAIELAAARSRLLGPRALLDELRASPLEALAGGGRDLPARQRTLQATLDWSFGLLAAREQALLSALGLFAGDWSLGLARKALGTELVTLDALGALVDHSLVRPLEGAAVEPRFGLLEVVRRYALERLAASGREAAARERWARALLAVAEEAARGLRGPAQATWLMRLDAERANLGALLGWALEGVAGEVDAGATRGAGADDTLVAGEGAAAGEVDAGATRGAGADDTLVAGEGAAAGGRRAGESAGAGNVAGGQEAEGDVAGGRAEAGARLVAALLPYWWRRGLASEARYWVGAALGRAQAAGQVARARLLAQAARLAWQQGEQTLAVARADEALDLGRRAGDAAALALARLTLGGVAWYRGDLEMAEAMLGAVLAQAGAGGEAWVEAEATLLLALVAYYRGDHARREELLARSLDLTRAAGDSLGSAEALFWAGNLAVEQGALDEAGPAYDEALAQYVALGDRDGEARALHKLSDLAHDRGDLAEARARLAACLAIRRAIGDQAGVATALIGRGDILLREGDRDGAAVSYGEALVMLQARGDQVDRAWALRGLARVARARGEEARALRLFAESLRLAWAQANPWGIAVCLEGLGGALAALGDPWAGAVLFGAADGVRGAHGLRVVPSALPDGERDRAAARALLGDERYGAALREGSRRPSDVVVAEALARAEA